ncbi:MAG TPA: S41 family peptidase [Thermomicrobiaceae bacterium]|nr:S41 family peptidase [Thermomicrobiaceae bacterium]
MDAPSAESPQPRPPGRRPHHVRFRLLLVAILGTFGIFATGLGAGVVADQVLIHPPTVTAIESDQVPSPIKEVWTLIHDHYVDQSKINDPGLTAAAITGMLDTLGDQGHTRYLTPDQLAQHDQSLSGSYVGVGIQIQTQNNTIVVTAPIDGSPAAKAGVKAGDVLVAIDGQSVSGMTVDQAVQLVRGPEGSFVDLAFQRAGQSAPLTFHLQRTKLAVSSIDWTMLPGQVADIHISQFAQGATTQLAAAIKSAQSAGATGIVLDLRDDPGGLVDEAMGVASQFLTPGAPVYISQVRDGTRTTHGAEADVAHTSLPVVILVNKGTASASEIVSGALQQDHRAKVVGEPTYGTGTVLSQYGLSDGSAVLLGTELWLTPSGALIKDHGITPDYTVAVPQGGQTFTPVTNAIVSTDAVAHDPQLQAGLAVLRGDPVPGAPPQGASCLLCI